MGSLARQRLEADVAAHQLDQPAADGEAQAGAAEAAVRSAFFLGEGLEEPQLGLVADADAGVAHREVEPDLAVFAEQWQAIASSTRPLSVNFSALPSRLSSTWRRREAAP